MSRTSRNVFAFFFLGPLAWVVPSLRPWRSDMPQADRPQKG
jgi:hypothetical protein